MKSIEQKMAEDYVNSRWPDLKGELRAAAIRGYLEGYKSAPPPIFQLELNFD